MIYYPHYTPSRQHLRSILLFSDQINLLVPAVDQEGVRQRGHIREIIEKQPDLIVLKDPQGAYDGWVDNDRIHLVLQNLISDASDLMSASEAPLLKKDKYGNLESGQEVVIEILRSNHGWKYVAVEKFPYQVHQAVFESQCAARAGAFIDKKTGRVVEQNGALCHPLLADFVLCRMARQASIVEALPSITFGGVNYMNHLLDGEQSPNSPEQALMQSALDLFVPDNLSMLKIEDFLAVWKEYKELRRSVWMYLGSMVAAENLNMSAVEQIALFERLAATREKIRIEVVEVAKEIGDHRFKHGLAIALEAAATIGGAAFGAVFSGVPGAMAGAGIGLAGGKYANKLSTVGTSNGNLRSVAMAKARIERMGLQKRWDAPSYWTV